jgi:hypothetical protein
LRSVRVAIPLSCASILHRSGVAGCIGSLVLWVTVASTGLSAFIVAANVGGLFGVEVSATNPTPANRKIAQSVFTGRNYRSDVAQCLNRIKIDSGVASAGLARAHLSAFFDWSWRNGHCKENPVRNTPTYETDTEHKRVLSSDELRAVWNACGGDDYGKIVKLLILTGCRREEIGGLRWSEFNDLDAGVVTIPGERTKNH